MAAFAIPLLTSLPFATTAPQVSRELMVAHHRRNNNYWQDRNIDLATVLRTLPALERTQHHLISLFTRTDVVSKPQWDDAIAEKRASNEASCGAGWPRLGMPRALLRYNIATIPSRPPPLLPSDPLAPAAPNDHLQLRVGPLPRHLQGAGHPGAKRATRGAPHRAARSFHARAAPR